LQAATRRRVSISTTPILKSDKGADGERSERRPPERFVKLSKEGGSVMLAAQRERFLEGLSAHRRAEGPRSDDHRVTPPCHITD